MNFEKPLASTRVILIAILLAITSLIYTPRLTMWIVFATMFIILWLNPNRFRPQIATLDKYPLLSKSLRQRMILCYLTGILAVMILIEIAINTTLSPIIAVPLGIAFVIIALYGSGYLILSRYQVLMQTNENTADERDIQNKNRAFRLAFKIIIAGSFIAFYLVPDIAKTFFDLPQEAEYFPYYLGKMQDVTYQLLWLLVFSLPVLVYTWLEPDPISDEITLRETP